MQLSAEAVHKCINDQYHNSSGIILAPPKLKQRKEVPHIFEGLLLHMGGYAYLVFEIDVHHHGKVVGSR